MKKTIFFLSMFSAIIALIFSSCTKNQNWTGWRGENRDARVVGFNSPENWPSELTKTWQVDVGYGDGSPLYVDGKLFLHITKDSTETALCLDAETGKEIWSTKLNKSPVMKGGSTRNPGPRSTPVIQDGKLLLLGAGGVVSCVEAASGKITWQVDKYKEVPKFWTSFSPLIVDNKCIVHLGGRDNGVVVAFNVTDGSEAWTIKNKPCTYSSPVMMDINKEEIIVVQGQTVLMGISLEGKLLWEIPTPVEKRYSNGSTPIVDGSNVIIGSQGIGTRSFHIKKNEDDYVFSENWHNSDFGVSFNTPILKDGYLYAHGPRLGKMFCLNASNGETCWSDTITRHRFTLTLDLGKELLSLPAHGEILVFEPNHQTLQVIAKYKLAETLAYSYPLVVGNTLYIKENQLFTRWEI